MTIPVLGLSVLVHLVIILWCAVVRGRRGSCAMRRKPVSPRRPSATIAVGVVVAVFLVVLGNAGILIYASIKNQYSSIKLVGAYVASHRYALVSPSSMPPEALAADCVSPIPRPDEYGWSIVEYLRSEGRDFSLAARAGLAAEFGVTLYVGSAEQNMRLLEYMLAAAVHTATESAGCENE